MMSDLLVSFGGHTLRVVSDSPQVFQAFQTHLRHCPAQTDSAPIAEFQITAVEAGFSISADGSLLFPSLNFDLTLQALLTEVISRLVAVCDRGLVIHAAALAQDGNAVILSAQGGSGKSTLAAWLTADGFQYLTDEVIEIPLDLRPSTFDPRPSTLDLRPVSTPSPAPSSSNMDLPSSGRNVCPKPTRQIFCAFTMTPHGSTRNCSTPCRPPRKRFRACWSSRPTSPKPRSKPKN